MSNSSTKSKSHLETYELLDRFELLYENVDELKDLRRSILDQDLSSIFRLVGTVTRSRLLYDELRKAVIETNLHSVFRVLETLDKKDFEELRKAVLEKNIHSLFRVMISLSDNNEKMQLLRNVIINEGKDTEVLFKAISIFVKSDLAESLQKTLRTYPESTIKDAFARGQLHSKRWLVSEVEKIGMHLGTVFLCAGWYGTLASMIFESKKIHVDKIRSFDVDETCWTIAESINKPWVMNEWKFKATTQDIHTINFEGHLYNSLRSNGTPRELYDVPNTIINTSCEHIENWDKWWNSIPDGKLCILQSNNYKELSEHINCVDNVDHFKSIAPMKNYLYEGDLNLGKYIRYMIIGIK